MPEGGKKHDSEKAPMDLLPQHALDEISKVLAFGAAKYGRFNWRKGIEWSRVISAAMRHLTSFNEGEEFDKESGLSHASHAACNLMFLIQYMQDNKDKDDRYKPDVKKV